MIVVDDDPEGAQGNGRCVQEGAKAMGKTPTEGREGKVGISQQLQDRAYRGEHGEERLGGQFSLAGSGEHVTIHCIIPRTHITSLVTRNVLLTIAAQPVPCITIIKVAPSSFAFKKPSN